MYEYGINNGRRSGLIRTQHGDIRLPAFMPVTTFGGKYPLDSLVRPYLPRLSDCIMVSYHYARQIKERPSCPLFIDSGGFVGLFEGSEFIEYQDRACIKTKDGDLIDPEGVLAFQKEQADLAATVDFIIPPDVTDEAERRRRMNLTVKNALYAKEHTGDSKLMLYASLQSWDEVSAGKCAKIYADAGFQGIAIGGMVPHSSDPEHIIRIAGAVREAAPECAIHLFGCGNSAILKKLGDLGIDSTDSSSYIRSAVGDAGIGKGIHGRLHVAIKNLKDSAAAANDVWKRVKIPNIRVSSGTSESLA